jgi:hypothetical protein
MSKDAGKDHGMAHLEFGCVWFLALLIKGQMQADPRRHMDRQEERRDQKKNTHRLYKTEITEPEEESPEIFLFFTGRVLLLVGVPP